nr:hypothetical protein [Tanacetum cinerariifolium]
WLLGIDEEEHGESCGSGDYCVGFGGFTQLVPRVIKD